MARDIKKQIAALLAKAESTDSPEERDSLTAKAEELMLRYGVEQAEAEAAGKVNREEISHEMIQVKSNFVAIVPSFFYGVTEALGSLEMLKFRAPKQWWSYLDIIGYKTDVDNAVALLNSLWAQANQAVAVWRTGEALRDPIYAASDRQYRWRADREFVAAFGREVARRIRVERKQQEKTVSTGAALVLVDKKDAVTAWMHSQHNVGRARATSRKGAMSGREAGRAAGARADIGNKRIGGTRGQLR